MAYSDLLSYDPETGVFRWKVDRQGHARAGDVAGHVNKRGYRYIGIDGREYRAHRLAWFFVYGVWPMGQLDHRNGDFDDNRIVNLREATNGQNQHNINRPRRNNRSGFRGVYLHRHNGWRARIRANGVVHDLGVYSTPEDAAAAYQAAKRDLHPFSEVAS